MLNFWDAAAIIVLAFVCSAMVRFGQHTANIIIEALEEYALSKLKERQL